MIVDGQFAREDEKDVKDEAKKVTVPTVRDQTNISNHIADFAILSTGSSKPCESLVPQAILPISGQALSDEQPALLYCLP